MLPKEIYVWQEEDSDGEVFLMAQKEIPDEDGLRVGIYTLKEMKVVKIQKCLNPDRRQ